MLDIYTVCFFGHRRIDRISAIETQLEQIVSDLIRQKEYVQFLVGHEGEFDELCSVIIRRVKKKLDYGNAELTLVLPYAKSGFDESFENYDTIEVCEEAANSHFKAAISVRNRCMCECSDLAVCYVTHKGGAYKALEYAKSLNIKTIELH